MRSGPGPGARAPVGNRGHQFEQLAIGPPRAQRAPAAPVNEFEDCPPSWQADANRAVVTARRWVANLLAGFSVLPTPIPAPVAALLNKHFHTTNRDDITEIQEHFVEIHEALNEPIDFECESECDKGEGAYVYGIWSDIHLCPVWHGQSPDGQANAIVHELAHDAADRDDEAYVWQPEYATLDADDAIDNADSYSFFAQESFGP